ncbi:MAG TPA: efflux RND transporter periplasmic adaptor subunit [Polyangiaceae bacterium]
MIEQAGEEGPPRGVRLMAVVRWTLVVLMAVVAAFSAAYSFGFTPGAAGQRIQYHCPMHPQIVQDHPGECPICGMTLVPWTPHAPAAPDAAKTTAPAASAGSHAGHRHNPSDPFACPMHPEESGTSAEDRCPICNMKLTRRKVVSPPPSSSAPPAAPVAPSSAAPLPSGVPGLVPVELGFDRVQTIGMRTAPAVTEPLAPELRTVGFVTADEARLARVHSRFSGWIERLAVATTGAKVRQGQVLAELYNLELLPAQQEFLAARRWNSGAGGTTPGLSTPLEEAARQRLELFGMSKREIDAVAESGKAARTIAVTAPRGGYVVQKNAVQGAYVQPGTELFEIADLSRVWVLADVYEYDIARVALGQSATVVLGAYPNERFAGKVGFVSPILDSATRTLSVRVELDNKEGKLRPGLYADVTLALGAASGVVVPAEALVDTGEFQYVFVAKDGGRFEPRRVRAGARSGARVQILEGLAAGETVVTTANFLIDSESRLRAAIESGPNAAPAHSAH